MKISFQRMIVPAAAVLCVAAVTLLIPAVHLPRDRADLRENGKNVSAPPLDSLAALPPSMNDVVSKHLFIIQRAATGLNSYPDLVVKGVFLGVEQSAVFSLKSRPQANLRIWKGNTENALSQVIDQRDPRQPIAQFLREWDILEFAYDGVKVKHFITGEVETYAVNYTPERKVRDDAARGYGQGIMPQNDGTGGGGNAQRNTSTQSRGAPPPTTTASAAMADRVSAMLRQMPAAQRQQFMQRLNQGQGQNQGQNQNSAQRGNDPRNSTQQRTTTQNNNNNSRNTPQQNQNQNRSGASQQQNRSGNTQQQQRR